MIKLNKHLLDGNNSSCSSFLLLLLLFDKETRFSKMDRMINYVVKVCVCVICVCLLLILIFIEMANIFYHFDSKREKDLRNDCVC